MRKVILMMCMLCSVWSIAQNKPKGNVANETRLNVTNSYLDFDYSGGSTSISVNSNVSWVLKNTASDFFAVIRDGNTVTIRCAVNNDYTHRDGVFDVVTNNGAVRKRISVHQSYIYDRHPQPFAQQLQNVQIKITNVRQEHNVSENGKLGMKIHLSISIFNGPHIRYAAFAWFNVQKRGQMIPLTYYGTSSYTNRQDQVFSNVYFVSTTTNETLSDVVIFMPYEELHQEGNFGFTIDISALQKDNEWSSILASWENERFTYRKTSTTGSNELVVNDHDRDFMIIVLQGGGERTFQVKSEGDYYVEVPSFCTLTSKKSDSFSLNIPANTSKLDRYGTIRVWNSSKKIEMTFTQPK